MPPSTRYPIYRFGDILIHPTIPNIVWMVVCIHPSDPGTAIAVRARDGGTGGWMGLAGEIGSINIDPRVEWKKVNP